MEMNRRASPRFRAKPGNYVTFVEGSGAIRDLSIEGVFVLDPEPLTIGTIIRFSLRLGTQEVPVQGIVRRSVEKEGMAIQFTELSQEARRSIRLHTANLSETD